MPSLRFLALLAPISFFSGVTHAQVWTDAAGTAVRDGECTIAGQCEERGTKQSSAALSQLDLSAIHVMSDDLYEVVTDLANILDGPEGKAIANCSPLNSIPSSVRIYKADSSYSSARYPVGSRNGFTSEITNGGDFKTRQTDAGFLFQLGDPSPSWRLFGHGTMAGRATDYNYFYQNTPKVNGLTRVDFNLPPVTPVIELDDREGFMFKLRYNGGEYDLLDERAQTLEDYLPPGGTVTYSAKSESGGDATYRLHDRVIHAPNIATPVSVVGFYYQKDWSSNGDKLSYRPSQEMIMSAAITPDGRTRSNGDPVSMNLKRCDTYSSPYCDSPSGTTSGGRPFLWWDDSRISQYIGVGRHGVGADLREYDRYQFWANSSNWRSEFPFLTAGVGPSVMPTRFQVPPVMTNAASGVSESGGSSTWLRVGYSHGQGKSVKRGDLIIGAFKIHNIEHVKVGGTFTDTIIMEGSPYMLRSSSTLEPFDPSYRETLIGAHYLSSLINNSGSRDINTLVWADSNGVLPVEEWNFDSPIRVTYQCTLQEQ